VRRAALVALAAGISLSALAPSAFASDPLGRILVLQVHDASLRDLLSMPGAGRVARGGGAALLEHADLLAERLSSAPAVLGLPVSVEDLGSGEAGLAALRSRLAALQNEVTHGLAQIWIVSDGSSQPGDELGAVLFSPFQTSGGEPRSLTSDSTRRTGVVVAEDVVPTMCSVAQEICATGSGTVMRPVDVPPPLDLYDRYLANRRMSVPIQTAAGLYVTFAGLLGVGLLAAHRRVPPWLLSLGAWVAIAVLPFALALLLAGHLPTLSYATVLPALIGGTLFGTAAFVPVARRRGTLEALTWMGAVVLAVFVLEAVLGWTAAMFTFLGGTELDGGRFYGLPNVDIGLLLGASLFIAHRLRRTAEGVALIAAVALFAGLPFAGANLGAAVTLSATAGLWWGLRDRRGTIPTALACVAAAGVGLVVVLILNRVLPGPPTHITNFVEGQGDGVLSTVVHRLRTGFDLIARNPFAIVPVIGVPATLLAVLRPAAPVRASFEQHPGWREALLTILWGSVVAYVANDTGAAALGLGFGAALGGLLFVSLRDRPWMMETS
jgi:hypothetical protein